MYYNSLPGINPQQTTRTHLFYSNSPKSHKPPLSHPPSKNVLALSLSRQKPPVQCICPCFLWWGKGWHSRQPVNCNSVDFKDRPEVISFTPKRHLPLTPDECFCPLLWFSHSACHILKYGEILTMFSQDNKIQYSPLRMSHSNFLLYKTSEQSKSSLPFPLDEVLQSARMVSSKTDKEVLLLKRSNPLERQEKRKVQVT